MRPVPVASELMPGLRATLTEMDPAGLSIAALATIRAGMVDWPGVDEVRRHPGIELSEHCAPGADGGPPVPVTILSPRGHAERIAAGAKPVPGLLNIHGGGMMVGNRMMDTPRLAALVVELGVVAATVEYRLAPEHPHPAPVEDCHAALVWFAQQAAQLGVDPKRIVVMGGSAGGGLSAGVALIARDRNSVQLAGQLLLCPMIDDRNTTASSRQYLADTIWTRGNNELGWSCLLGAAKGTDTVSCYAAPARAEDVGNLPPAYIEAGSAEVFRDESVDYASRIWAAGGSAELHVWSGGFHGFDLFAADTQVARAAIAARLSWLKRTLDL